MKKSYLLLLLIAFTGIAGCQKDIPVLGQEEGDNTSKSEVYIRSITLFGFSAIDPNTMLSWDAGSVQPFDSLDDTGPDIYFNLYHKSDEGLPMSFHQLTHFANVLPLHPDTPLVYYLVPPFQILPEYIDTTIYLTMYDLDFADPLNDSMYMDSIPFTVGSDDNVTFIDSSGFNGSRIILGLEWK
ncbi:MAG TPA: hypothetical protein VJY62_18010 [Bacteroidia bacterium]|nr:hypothetical protein [Bacteroidia bacterium]